MAFQVLGKICRGIPSAGLGHFRVLTADDVSDFGFCVDAKLISILEEVLQPNAALFFRRLAVAKVMHIRRARIKVICRSLRCSPW